MQAPEPKEPKDRIFTGEDLEAARVRTLEVLGEAVGITLTGAHNSEHLRGAINRAHDAVAKNIKEGGITGEQIVSCLVKHVAVQLVAIEEEAAFCADLLISQEGESELGKEAQKKVELGANIAYHSNNLSLAVNGFANQLGLKGLFLTALGQQKTGGLSAGG